MVVGPISNAELVEKLREMGAIKEGESYDDFVQEVNREAKQIKAERSAPDWAFELAERLEHWARGD